MVDGGSRRQEPSFPPSKVAAISFHLQMSPREVKPLVQGITAPVSLRLPHSEALCRSHLPTRGPHSEQEVSGRQVSCFEWLSRGHGSRAPAPSTWPPGSRWCLSVAKGRGIPGEQVRNTERTWICSLFTPHLRICSSLIFF